MTIEEFIRYLNYYQVISIWHRKSYGYMYTKDITDIAGKAKLTKQIKESKITEISTFTNGTVVIHCEG